MDIRSPHSRALPVPLRIRLERYFQTDLSEIRISEDLLAESAGTIAAASGNTIHVRRGLRNLLSGRLLRVLVHEVAHCLQQRGHAFHTPGSAAVIVDRPDLESEANAAAEHFVRGGRRFKVAPRMFRESAAVLQCIDTTVLRNWLGAGDYELLKAALPGAFGVLLATDEATLRRFDAGNSVATRTALANFFGAIAPLNPRDAGELCRLLTGCTGAQMVAFVQGLNGLNGTQILQFVQAQNPAPIAYLRMIVQTLQPLTGLQISALVQNLKAGRNFSVMQIYLLCTHLRTLNGNQINTFLNTYTLVSGGAMLPVLNTCCQGVPCLTGAQLNDIVLAVGHLPGAAAGFTIHGVLRTVYGPLGPARMHSIAQLNARCLVRLERVVGALMTPLELTTAVGCPLLIQDQQLHDFLQEADVAHLIPAEWAYLLKVMSAQEAPILPADTLAKKAALFFQYHCQQRGSDILVGDDTPVEQTTNNNPSQIRTNRGGWKDVNKIHVRLSRRGLNHFKRRHFFEHFDFTDIKDMNTFFLPGTDITTNQLFLVAAGTIEQLSNTNINNGFVTHEVTIGLISYRAGVYWTASPADTPAQPIARFDQFFITNAPVGQVIRIPRAELEAIERLLIAAGRIA